MMVPGGSTPTFVPVSGWAQVVDSANLAGQQLPA